MLAGNVFIYASWPQDDIWKPDLRLNSSYDSFTGFGSAALTVWVTYDGNVSWNPFQLVSEHEPGAVEFKLELKRISRYYTYHIIAPTILVTLLMPFTFALSGRTDERIGFARISDYRTTILLIFSWTLFHTSEKGHKRGGKL
ncbi:hypothetical protein DPMN_145423 [Dreissena polymorpha]|uniref:Neurotransmitter-gated ion-channel ligand-binding domain-containing protein n=1 Tax=Dreissena polymorpha TaxID=45954 RepID=A0A9D4F4X2_DREPO|nr:hypothetical protein DPMN_145423 [Dreissena polymorpha]